MGIESSSLSVGKSATQNKPKTKWFKRKNSAGKTGETRLHDSALEENSSAVDFDTDKRFLKQYNLVKTKVLEAKLRPSYRQLESKTSVTSKYIKPILYRLENEGVTVKTSNGWKLAVDSSNVVAIR